jgi:predicted PurR-regulated permease PerM
MLRYQDELIDLLKRISPFDNSINDLYLKRAGLMTKGMVKGQFIIASVQGFASAFSLWIVGVDYFWFLFVFLSFLSFIPLGAGIITIPIGFVFILTGHFWQGAFIILWHMFVVSSIDNILRPHLVDKDARLNTALMLLAVFSGIAVFGAAGVVYGPVIMILIVTTIYVYAEFNKSAERISLPGKKLVSGKPTPK